VVEPGQEDGAALVSSHEVDLPEGHAQVERRAHQVADQLLQLRLAARCRERDAVEMGVEIEVIVIDPARGPDAEASLDHPLPEAVEGKQALVEQGADPAVIEWSLENEHPGHHHQVGRVLHPQPGRVDARQRL